MTDLRALHLLACKCDCKIAKMKQLFKLSIYLAYVKKKNNVFKPLTVYYK